MSLTIRDAYGLWKAGHDTFDIAAMTGRKEQEITRDILVPLCPPREAIPIQAISTANA